jgi:hypothetical protein
LLCDHDGSDPLGFKSERFTVLASIVIAVWSIIYGIPLAWYLLKLAIKLIFHCCEYEVIEEVDDDELEEDEKKKE